MQKITDYIIKGKGIGSLWLLLLGTLLAFLSAYDIHKTVPSVVPHIQQFADEFLPIEIKNGQVVTPQDTIITHTYDFNNIPLTFTLDTTKEVLEEGAKPGVYLTKSYLYSISEDEVRRQNLADIKLEKKDYTPLMYRAIRIIVWTTLLCAPFFNFLCFLIAVAFYALCSALACALSKKQLPFKTKMRLNTVLFVGLYVLTYLLYFVGLSVSTLAFFLMMIALQLIVIKKLPE